MTEIDLHIHTYLSDGTLSPEDAILYAKKRGIKVLAIADHETLAHFDEYCDFAEQHGVKLIPAIEINVSDYKNFHFVGYGINTPEDRQFIEQYLGAIRQRNIGVCQQVLKLLKDEYGIEFSEDEVRVYNVDGVLDKKAIAKALIDKGYAPNTKEAYDLYIGRDARAYVPIEKITAQQAIDLIHLLRGVVVWAHPFTVRKTKTAEGENRFSLQEMAKLVESLKGMGLDGIECFTSKTTPLEDNFLIELAKQHNLLITGGSDFHNHHLNETIGSPKLTLEHIVALETRIEGKNRTMTPGDKEKFLNKYGSERLP